MKSHARTMARLKMQRRHFQLIANILREERPEWTGDATTRWDQGTRDEWCTIVLRFASRLAGTNPQFDREAFLDACGYTRADVPDDEPREVDDRGAAHARKVRGF